MTLKKCLVNCNLSIVFVQTIIIQYGPITAVTEWDGVLCTIISADPEGGTNYAIVERLNSISVNRR